MTENEKDLINVIRGSENPEQALVTATVIILDFLKQLVSSEEPTVVYLRGLA